MKLQYIITFLMVLKGSVPQKVKTEPLWWDSVVRLSQLNNFLTAWSRNFKFGMEIKSYGPQAVCSYPTPSKDVLKFDNRSSSEIFSISTSIPLFASEDTNSPTDQKFNNVDDSTTETLILPTADLDDNFKPLVTTYKATESEINLISDQDNGASSIDLNEIITPLFNVVHGTSTNQTSYNYIESQNHTVLSSNMTGNHSDILDSHEVSKDLIAVALEEVSNTSSEANIFEPNATEVDLTTQDDMLESKDFDNATVLVSENLEDSHIK